MEKSTVALNKDRYPGIVGFLNIKRQALGYKPLNEMEMTYEVDEGPNIFLAGEWQLNKQIKEMSREDARMSVSASKLDRLRMAIKHKNWKGRKLLEVVLDPEDERVSIDYK
jgi:hypothetical protein